MGDALFLMGGGELNPQGGVNIAEPFFKAAGVYEGKKILMIVITEDADDRAVQTARYADMLYKAGCTEGAVRSMSLCRGDKADFTEYDIKDIGGVFTAGGLTPLYGEILCADGELKRFLETYKLPYAGYSAGAAIASETAVTGGYQIVHKGLTRPVLHEDSSEGLDPISNREGLGLFPLTLDVHASYWGNITRALFTARQLKTPVLAVDESTMVMTDCEKAMARGNGFVYGIYPGKDKSFELKLYEDGDVILL